jgi:putative membrane protein
MSRFILRWFIIAASVAAAAWIVPGIDVADETGWAAIVLFAGVLGLVNVLIRPILKFLSCGCIALTLGLFIIVVNAVSFWLAARIAEALGIGFTVDTFWSALAGSLVVSIVSMLLNAVFDQPGQQA